MKSLFFRMDPSVCFWAVLGFAIYVSSRCRGVIDWVTDQSWLRTGSSTPKLINPIIPVWTLLLRTKQVCVWEPFSWWEDKRKEEEGERVRHLENSVQLKSQLYHYIIIASKSTNICIMWTVRVRLFCRQTKQLLQLRVQKTLNSIIIIVHRDKALRVPCLIAEYIRSLLFWEDLTTVCVSVVS